MRAPNNQNRAGKRPNTPLKKILKLVHNYLKMDNRFFYPTTLSYKTLYLYWFTGWNPIHKNSFVHRLSENINHLKFPRNYYYIELNKFL